MVDCKEPAVKGLPDLPGSSSDLLCHLLSVFYLCRNLNVASGFGGHQGVSKKIYTLGDVKFITS